VDAAQSGKMPHEEMRRRYGWECTRERDPVEMRMIPKVKDGQRTEMKSQLQFKEGGTDSGARSSKTRERLGQKE
jgi:hypothetical protein